MTRIVQIADVHFGSECPIALRAFEDRLPDLQPDGIIVSGDLTQNGKRSEFREATTWLEKLQIPSFQVPGNHDTPMFDLYARMTSPFSRYEKYFGPTCFANEIGELAVGGLNTSRGWQVRRNWAEGSVNLDDLREILDRTTNLKKESDAAELSCLVCHHPFHSPPGAALQTRTRRGRRASEILAKSPVNLLLCGHVHTPTANIWRHEAGAYLCLTAGTLSTRRRDWPVSFNLIDVTADQIHVQQYDLVNTEFDCTVERRWSSDDLEPMPA